MKTRTLFLILTHLVVAGIGYAQRFPTNSIGHAQAVKVASQLWAGIREQEVAKTPDQQNGLKCGGDVGDSIGWTRFYLLADGCFLDLEMKPKQVTSDGKWGGNGLLQAAWIQSNDVRIVSITLTNKP